MRAFLDVFKDLVRKMLVVAPREQAARFIEGCLRLKELCNPSVHCKSLRIKKIINCGERKSGTHVVFVAHAKQRIPEFTLRGIRAFHEAGCTITVVFNGNLTQSIEESLKPHCWRIIQRANIGRDFGGYKDAILNLFDLEKQKHIEIERLVLANDSIYYFDHGLNAMVEGLIDCNFDFVGTCENYERHYHVQSFLLGFSRDIVHSKAFKKYWQSYVPISTRRWSIHKGEVKLSKIILKQGFVPHILYDLASLKRRLNTLSDEQVHKLIRVMPLDFRERDSVHAFDMWDEPTRQMFSQAKSLRRLTRASFKEFDDLASISLKRSNITSNYTLEKIRAHIMEYISDRNQMNVAGMLLIQNMDMPILKRDIIYRGFYHIYEVFDILKPCGILGSQQELMADFRRKGIGKHLRGFKKFLYDVGIV